LICVKCGHNNNHGGKFCENCKAQFPNFSDYEILVYPKVNERYLRLKNAGDKVKVGEWTTDEFIAFLDQMSNILAQKESEIREIEIPDETFKDFQEELETGFAGIELYNLGIAEMRLFIEDFNSEHLEKGLHTIADGNEKINEAMRINRINHIKLEEQYPFTSTFM
jgi:hypothetical protein